MCDYERAVYDEECDMLARAIILACRRAAAIPDRRARTAIISAALLTAGQMLDGNKMPEETYVIKPGGVVESMAYCLSRKAPR